jgi:DNA-binding PadR family transcriptional regulator
MRYPFLALLAAGPAHGYELKQEVEQRFGRLLPPLNAGQIYTTLGRLERDGLVRGDRVEQNGRPNKRVYALTDAGRSSLEEWLAEPAPGTRLKDEFFMKLVLAGFTGVADPKLLIERQRREYLQSLRDLDQLADARRGDGDPATELLIEGAALHLQADLKWLDLCDLRLSDQEASDGSSSRG